MDAALQTFVPGRFDKEDFTVGRWPTSDNSIETLSGLLDLLSSVIADLQPAFALDWRTEFGQPLLCACLASNVHPPTWLVDMAVGQQPSHLQNLEGLFPEHCGLRPSALASALGLPKLPPKQPQLALDQVAQSLAQVAMTISVDRTRRAKDLPDPVDPPTCSDTFDIPPEGDPLPMGSGGNSSPIENDTIFVSLIVAPLSGTMADGPRGGWKAIRKDSRDSYFSGGGKGHPGFSRIVGMAWSGNGAEGYLIECDEREALEEITSRLNTLRNEGSVFTGDDRLLKHFLIVRCARYGISVPEWLWSPSKMGRWLQSPRHLFSPFCDPIGLGALAVMQDSLHTAYDIESPILFSESSVHEFESLLHVGIASAIIDSERHAASASSFKLVAH